MPKIQPIQNSEMGYSVRGKINQVINRINGLEPVLYSVTSPSASWSFDNPLSVFPDVQVYLETGEKVYPDIYVTQQNINVMFALPQTGYIVIS